MRTEPNAWYRRSRVQTGRALVLLGWVLAVVVPHAVGQERLAFEETGVAFTLPASWATYNTTSLTDKLPAFAFHYALNTENGQRVSLHVERCPDAERRNAWASGELARTQLDYRTDRVVPLAENAPVRRAGSSGFMTTATGGTVTYQGYAFFFVEGDTCYMLEVTGQQREFEANASVFQQLVDGVGLP